MCNKVEDKNLQTRIFVITIEVEELVLLKNWNSFLLNVKMLTPIIY